MLYLSLCILHSKQKSYVGFEFSSVQFSYSVVYDSVIPWTAAPQGSLSITNSQRLLKLMSIELAIPSKHLTLCHPLLLLPSIFTSIRIFSNESVLHIRWPEYCTIQPVNKFTIWMLVSLLLPLCFKHLLTWFYICIRIPRTTSPQGRVTIPY